MPERNKSRDVGVLRGVARALTESNHSSIVSAYLVRLTSREHRIVTLIGEGRTDREIAKRLWLALGTVQSDVRSIIQKLVLHTLSGASALSIVGDAPGA
jgi:DNA-binding NarL/FixJ family response regulator